MKVSLIINKNYKSDINDGVFTTGIYLNNKLLLKNHHLKRLIHDVNKYYFRDQLSKYLELKIRKVINLGFINQNDELKGIWRLKILLHKKKQGDLSVIFYRKKILNQKSKVIKKVKIIKDKQNHPYNIKIHNLIKKNYCLQKNRHYYQDLIFERQNIICELSYANIFLIKNKKIITLTLNNRLILPGIMREFIIKYFKKNPSKLILKNKILKKDLLEADFVFGCNCVKGVFPVLEIEGVKKYNQNNKVYFRLKEYINRFYFLQN